MRLPHIPISCFLGLLAAGCNPTAPTEPGPSATATLALTADAAASSCTLALHAILRDAGGATVGQVQFRVIPPEPGASDATVDYQGVYVPTEGRAFGVLSVALRSRVPDQSPSWSDSDKTDPGATLASVAHFGRVAPMSQDMALALVDDASRFKAVVNVTSTTGGREAEGLVEPDRSVPESLRDRQRLCFGGG